MRKTRIYVQSSLTSSIMKKLTLKEEINKSYSGVRWLLSGCYFYPPTINRFKESPTVYLKFVWFVRWGLTFVESVSSVQEVLYLRYEAKNLMDVVDCLCTCIPDIMTAYVMLKMYYDRHLFIEIIDMMLAYAEDEDSKIAHPIISAKGKKVVIISYFFYFCLGGTILLHLVLPFLLVYQESKTVENVEWKVLAFHSYYYFPKNESPQYYFFFFAEILRGYVLSHMLAGNDGFYAGTIMMTAAFFNLLCKSVEGMSDLALDNISAKSHQLTMNQRQQMYEKEMVRLMKRYVRKHQQLLKICDLMDDSFSGFLFFHLVFHAVLLCLVGNQLLTVMGDKDFPNTMKYTIYIMALMLELLVYGYFGSELIYASQDVADSMMYSGWYSLNSKDFNDMTIFMMTRAQKSCKLTAKGYAIMSLETVVTMLSTAGSYFTILQTLKDEKED